MTGPEGEVSVVAVDMTVSAREYCCGLLKILDRRHDKTDKDEIELLRSASRSCSLNTRKQRQTQPVFRMVFRTYFFWPRKPTGLSLVILMIYYNANETHQDSWETGREREWVATVILRAQVRAISALASAVHDAPDGPQARRIALQPLATGDSCAACLGYPLIEHVRRRVDSHVTVSIQSILCTQALRRFHPLVDSTPVSTLVFCPATIQFKLNIPFFRSTLEGLSLCNVGYCHTLRDRTLALSSIANAIVSTVLDAWP
jgi:hypothetical protein